MQAEIPAEPESLALLVGQAIGVLGEVKGEVTGLRGEFREMNGTLAAVKVQAQATEDYTATHAKFHAENVPIATRRGVVRTISWVGGIAAAGGAFSAGVLALIEALRP